MRPPCDECVPCLDKPRNNGPGKIRKKCVQRICFRQDFKEKKKNKNTRKSKRGIKTKAREQTQSSTTSLSPSPFLCPHPECPSIFGSRNARRLHIAGHFKNIILNEYRYRKNSPCPKCEKTIKGGVTTYVTHLAYVHLVVGKLLPKNDKRKAFVRKYLS